MHVVGVADAFTRRVRTAKIPSAIQAKNKLKKLSHHSIHTDSFVSIVTPFLNKKSGRQSRDLSSTHRRLDRLALLYALVSIDTSFDENIKSTILDKLKSRIINEQQSGDQYWLFDEAVKRILKKCQNNKYHTSIEQINSKIQNLRTILIETTDFLAKSLFTPTMDECDRRFVTESLANVPLVERPAFIQQVQSLFTYAMNGYDRARVIKSLATLPSDTRTDAFIQQAQSLITPTMNGFNRAHVINSLATLPSDTRTDAFIQQAQSLFTPTMDGDDRGSVIKSLANLPSDTRTDAFIQQVQSLFTPRMDGFSRARVINSLANLPSDTRTDAFIQQAQSLITYEAQSLFTYPMNGDDRRSVIESLANVPLVERPAFIKQAQSLITPTLNGEECVRIITCLTNYYNLEKFTEDISLFENKTCSISIKEFKDLNQPVVLLYESLKSNRHYFLFEYFDIVKWHSQKRTNPNNPSHQFELSDLRQINRSPITNI